jgi:hypothetical protein
MLPRLDEGTRPTVEPQSSVHSVNAARADTDRQSLSSHPHPTTNTGDRQRDPSRPPFREEWLAPTALITLIPQKSGRAEDRTARSTEIPAVSRTGWRVSGGALACCLQQSRRRSRQGAPQPRDQLLHSLAMRAVPVELVAAAASPELLSTLPATRWDMRPRHFAIDQHE